MKHLKLWKIVLLSVFLFFSITPTSSITAYPELIIVLFARFYIIMSNTVLSYFPLAVKNQATDHLFLNNEGDFPESRTVIEKGILWEYSNDNDMETIQTAGPLRYGVLIMVMRMSQMKKFILLFSFTDGGSEQFECG